MNESLLMINQLFSYGLPEHFHFLRPLWLLSILPALGLACFFWRQKNGAVHWRSAINKHLLQHLLESGSKNSLRWPWLLLLTAWVIATIAIAGPTWEKLPQPVHQKQDALVIILDLSLSMQAEDIKPSRLIRARHKILDILDQRDEGLTALIAYSGDAHIVSPLTDDNATVANLLPALSPSMMPVYGSDPVSALRLAQQLFNNSGLSEGRILLVTDSITDNDVNDINDSISNSGFELSILGIGTTQGAPIPTQSGFIKNSSGTIVVPQLPRQRLDELARLNNGRYTDVSLDDKDIEFLLPTAITSLNTNTTASEREFDQWYDRGHMLVLCLLPLALLAFRRGWLLLLPLFILHCPQHSYAFEWKDLWQSRDQQAASALANGDTKAAANTFKNKRWQGAAQYKSDDFEAAAENFSQFDDAAAHYNRGNALAKVGKLDDAIEAYNEALKQQPDMEDAVFNKELLEKLKQQQQQNASDQKQDKNSQSEQNDNQQQQDKQSEQNSNQQQQDKQSEQNSNQQQQDKQSKQNNNQQDNNQQPSPEDPNDGADLPEQQPEQAKEKQPAKQNKPQQPEKNTEQQQAMQHSEQKEQTDKDKQQAQAKQAQLDQENQQQQQAVEQWLRQIPDEPSGLLRRKFDYEHRLKQQQQTHNRREQPKW